MKTLIDHLRYKQSHQLKAIADYWQIGPSPTVTLSSGRVDLLHLAYEMTNEYLQRRVIEKLGSQERQILQYFLGPPDHLAEPQTLNFPNLGPKELAGGLNFLKEVGLLYLDEQQVVPTAAEKAEALALARGKATRRYFEAVQVRYKPVLVLPLELARSFSGLFLEWQQSLGGGEGEPRQAKELTPGCQPLAQLLSRLEPEVFKARVRNLGLVKLDLNGKGNKGKLAFGVEAVAQALSDTYNQRQILTELEGSSRKLFERLKEAGGRMEIAALLKEYQGVKELGQALKPLKEKLLAWEGFEAGQGVVFVPSEILHPQTDSTPPPVFLQKVSAPANITPYPSYALAWDVLTFLSYLTQNRVELTNQGTIPVRDQKKIISQLWVAPDPKEGDKTREAAALARYTFLVESCRHLKLYESRYQENNRLVAGPALSKWLSLDLYEQARRLCRCWVNEGPKFTTLTENYPHTYYYYGLGKMVGKANEAMLSLLGRDEEAGAGEWYSLGSLLEKVHQEDPFFVVGKKELSKNLSRKGLAEYVRQWPGTEGVMIRKTFGTAMEWLGLVRVGRDERGQVVSFSPTELGVELAGAGGGDNKGATAKAAIPAVDKPLLVQPNFEIMVFVPQAATLWQLMKFANLRKLDQVSLYFLSRDSVLRGLENGVGLEEMLVSLERQSAQPLPQNLAVSVRDWSKAYKEVGVEPVTLLEVADPAVLDELLASKQFAASFVRRLSPTAAIVTLPDTAENRRTNPLKTFKSKLKSSGYFPRYEGLPTLKKLNQRAKL